MIGMFLFVDLISCAVCLILYYCIGRIINPEITIEFYTDGSNKVLSERWNGIIGLIVLIGGLPSCDIRIDQRDCCKK